MRSETKEMTRGLAETARLASRLEGSHTWQGPASVVCVHTLQPQRFPTAYLRHRFILLKTGSVYMHVSCFALQSAPGLSIAGMQYTRYSNKRQVFRAPCQMSCEGPGSVSTLMGSMAAEVSVQGTRKKGQGPGRRKIMNVKL